MTLLTIVCITYNQSNYIKQCLDGFVMQKTNFPFEVLVHDDASTDGTADIIREYEKKYPDIIKPIYQTENQWSKGQSILKKFVYPKIKSKYVALCEGDDYWTDPYKLQKQVDFLEAHPDYSICFHPVKVVWDDKSKPDSIFPSEKQRFNKTTLSLEDLIKRNFIQTNSVVYRWCLKDKLDLIPTGILPMDWFMHLLHAREGKIGFLPDVMAVYRRNSGGIWFNVGEKPEWYCNYYDRKIKFYIEVQKLFGECMDDAFYDIVTRTYYSALLLNKQNIVADLEKQFEFLEKPSADKWRLMWNMIALKIKSKISFKRNGNKNKLKYKALKFYKKWQNRASA